MVFDVNSVIWLKNPRDFSSNFIYRKKCCKAELSKYEVLQTEYLPTHGKSRPPTSQDTVPASSYLNLNHCIHMLEERVSPLWRHSLTCTEYPPSVPLLRGTFHLGWLHPWENLELSLGVAPLYLHLRQELHMPPPEGEAGTGVLSQADTSSVPTWPLPKTRTKGKAYLQRKRGNDCQDPRPLPNASHVTGAQIPPPRPLRGRSWRRSLGFSSPLMVQCANALIACRRTTVVHRQLVTRCLLGKGILTSSVLTPSLTYLPRWATRLLQLRKRRRLTHSLARPLPSLQPHKSRHRRLRSVFFIGCKEAKSAPADKKSQVGRGRPMSCTPYVHLAAPFAIVG